MPLPVTNLVLPTDLDGFVTRECPSCSRQFKLRLRGSAPHMIAKPESLKEDAQSEGVTGHCPLCHELVVHGNWRTAAQRHYLRNQRMKAARVAYSDQFLIASKGSRALIELAGLPPVFVSEAPREPMKCAWSYCRVMRTGP